MSYQIDGVIDTVFPEETVGQNGFKKRVLWLKTEEQYSQTLEIQFTQYNVELLDGYQSGEREADSIIPEFFNPNKLEIVANSWGGVLVKYPIIRGQIYEFGKRDTDKIYFRSPVIQKNEKGFYIGLVVKELEKGENGRYYLTNYRLEKNEFIKN